MREELAQFFFRSNYLVGNYVASSEKITFMLARLGGLISMIYNFLRIFIKPYARRKLLTSLSNYLYKFISNETKDGTKVHTINNKNVIISQKKAINFDLQANCLLEPNRIGSTTNENKSGVLEDRINESNILEKIQNFLNKYSKFEYSYFGFLFGGGRKRKKVAGTKNVSKIHNHQILLKALKKINNDMDIVELLKKNKEIERLKDLYFNKNERTLFEFFPKPIISTSTEKISTRKIEQRRNLKTNLKYFKSSFRPSNNFFKKMLFFKENTDKIEVLTYMEVFKAYKSIISQPNISENERRLIGFIKDPLEAILQQTSLNTIN